MTNKKAIKGRPKKSTKRPKNMPNQPEVKSKRLSRPEPVDPGLARKRERDRLWRQNARRKVKGLPFDPPVKRKRKPKPPERDLVKERDPQEKRKQVVQVLIQADTEDWSTQRLIDGIRGVLGPQSGRAIEYVVDRFPSLAPIQGTPRNLLREYERQGTTRAAVQAVGVSRRTWQNYRTKYNRENGGLWDQAIALIQDEHRATVESRMEVLRQKILNKYEQLVESGAERSVIKGMEALFPDRFAQKEFAPIQPPTDRKPADLTDQELDVRIAELERSKAEASVPRAGKSIH